MKKGRLFLFLLLLSVTFSPAVSLAASTGGGNPWDDLVDPSPFSGTKLDGTLSIYFTADSKLNCTSGYSVTPYMTVRLSKGFQLYAFQKISNSVCKNDVATIKLRVLDFLNDALFDIYHVSHDWRIKSISSAVYNDETGSRSFVADIQLAVKEK
jgi:hypothetical protein